MMPIKDNQDVACFYVTKHSWRGKYKRIFSVGTLGITTYNPSNLEVTNRWSHSDIFSVCPAPGDASEFVVAMRRNKDSGGGNSSGTGKADSMRFSSEHRPQILFQALRYRHLFATADQAAIKAEARDHYNAYKLHWSETRLPVMLRVGAASLDQLDPTTKVLLASYPYYKMESLIEVSGEQQGSFVVVSGGFGRMHLFTSNQSKEIMNKIVEAAPYYSGVQVRIQSSAITIDHFTEHRLGKYSGDEHVTSVSEFTVQKVAAGEGMAGGDLLEGGKRHLEPQRRTLCLTATCVVERDPQTYAAVTLRPLSSICSIVRSPENPQLFALEYDCGQVRSYMATDRDSLLATLLDAVRASGNRDVHVRMGLTPRGKRLGPLNLPVDEEVESMHLRFLQQPPGRRTFGEMVERFNANVPYSGLIHSVTQDGLLADNKEKKITAALQALMQRAANNPSSPGGGNKAAELSDPVALMELEAQFHALRRLAASKVGFAAFTNLAGFREYMGRKVVYALRGGEEGVAQAALDTTCALMQPMHCQQVHLHQPQDIRQEQLNKSSLLSSRTFLASLLDMWTAHVGRGTGALVVAAVLDFLTFALCVPYSETTDGTHFDVLLKMVAERGRSLFRLFQHHSLAIVKGAGLVMRAIVEEGEAEVAARMQDLALAEGALPRHLLAALFTIPPSLGDMASRAENSGKNGPLVVDSRLLAHRQLSRHLVGLWVAGHPTAMGLLKRIMPAGLLSYLDSEEKVPPHEEELLLERDNLKLAQAESEGKGGSWGFRKPTAAQWANMERQLRLVEKQVERTLQHWSARVGFSPDWVSKSGIGSSKSSSATADLSSRPIVLRKRRERIKSEANWPLFYHQFGKDHALPNLIWNHKTRDELRDALDNEVKSFVADREVASSGGTLSVSWNHAEFEVTYQCLADEIRIGDYYLRLLLERDGVNTGSLKAPSDKSSQEGNKTSNSASSSPIRRSYEFFNDLYHRFLLSAKPEMKCMCLQAMAIVYGRHNDDIGPFSDTKYIVEMLHRCMDRTERDRLLIFISNLALVRRNVKEFLDANGVRVLVDLLTLAHLHEGRATLPTAAILAGNTIEAAPKGQGESSSREEEKEWYYGGSSEEMKGPITFREMQKLWNENKLTARTRCWAQGMDGWRPLVQVPQLRWMLIAANSNPPVMDETRLALLVLDTLIRMCNFFPSRDADGAVIRPIPRVKRQISDPGVLPHLSQLLLTFEPGLVEKVCTLLWESLRDNPGSAIALLHHTGAVYFALMYTGSNVLPVARLLHLTHARLGASKNPNEDPGWPRGGSMLGQLLPEAMVSYLENHGPEKFAEIFLGEFDTPEAIWNTEMRRMMIERIAAHVADFSPRLRSNIRAQYVYCAIPAVRYPQLERELFCGIYYLRHLCDTTRFPEWPIARPVELLREILEAWRAEVEKKPPTMSIEEAYKVLGLGANTTKGKDKGVEAKDVDGDGKGSLKRYDEAAVRKAYYRLAAKYHPDKNPDGRDQFEAVNKAYEFLCSRSAWSAADGPDPNNIVLILKAQSILFERYTEELHPYKYAGYPQLIKTIRIETSDERLFCKEAPLLAAATELAYHTLQCSAINAEELRRERGLDALLDAFSRCVAVVGDSTSPTETAVLVCHNAIRCFTVAARFQACRDKMVEMTGLVPEICRVLRFKHLFRLCSSAVECISALSVDGILQMQLLQWGALTRLLPTFFAYDYTLDEGGVTRSENANQQEVSNRLAKLAVGACARLGGYLQSEGSSDDDSFLPRETPANPVARAALSALLTPYLARQLGKDQPQELLKILTSNTENPYLIWNNGTRAELGEHLEEQGKRSWGGSEGGDHALLADSSFKYSAHAKELMVGEVFLRIYNEQPTFPIENPKGLTIDLLEFIRNKSQLDQSSKPVDGSLIELDSDAVSVAEGEVERIQQVIMALRSLENVIQNNPGVDIQCIGHFTLLFSLLRPEELSPGVGWCKCRPEVQSGALGVLAIASRNQQCVEDIAANGAYVLPHLLMAIHSLPIGAQGSTGGASIIVALDTLHALMSNPKIVKEALARGAIIYLLAIFCDVARGTARSGGVTGRAGASITLREKSAELLGKMSADKLVGGKVRLVLGKLLPPALADSFRGDTGSTLSAASCVEAFEARHANPELVWDDDARRQLCSAIGNLAEGHYKSQRENLSTIWRLPEESALMEMLGGASTVGGGGEAVVGGVYLRLYVANPNWQLRRPREFLTELLDTCLGIMSRDPKTVDVEFLDLCTNAIVALLKSQPALADQVPALGHLPRLCQLMGKSALALVPKSSSAVHKREDPVPKAAIQILHQMSASQVCIEALSHTDCIAPLSAALRSPGLVIGDPTGGDVTAVACETLYRLFSANFDELVRQALHADLVPFLLSLLEGGGGTLVGGGAKAQVVKALKAMERSQVHGEKVANLLARSPVWADYRDQRHDLFISSGHQPAYLTGAPPGVAGYLTQGTTKTLPDAPPPLDTRDDDNNSI